MSTPLMSVVIPAYNEEDSIADCINSVLNQNFCGAYEIFVVNGPSTDRTAEIAKSMGVEVIQLDERGIGIAWRVGSEKSRGEVIAFTEADTIVPEEWLDLIFKSIIQDPSTVGVVGQYCLRSKPVFVNWIVWLISYIFDYFHSIWIGYYTFRGTNFAVRRNILMKCGSFDPKIRTHGDVELSSRITKFGKIKYNPKLIVQTSDRHIRNPKNFLKFLIRIAKAIYYIEIIKKPSQINRMFDIR